MSTDTNPPAQEEVTPQPPAPRKSRWLGRLVLLGVVLLGLLFALVAFAPTLISTAGARSFVVQQADGFVPGKVAVGNWSLGWFGTQTIEGLSVTDVSDREVIRVKKVEIQRGLLDLAMGGLHFGKVVLEEPYVLLHFEEDGQVSLSGAVAAETESKPASTSGDGALPDVSGELHIRGGQVELARDGFTTYRLDTLETDVVVDTVNDLKVKLQTALPDGNTLQADVALNGLAPNGKLDADQASGSGTVTSGGPVAIGDLVSVVTGQADLRGQANIDIKLDAAPGKLQADATIAVQNLVSEAAGGKPLNLTLRGTGGLENEQLQADVELSGARRFLGVKANGTTSNIDADLNADLAALHSEVSQVFDLGGLKFSGQATGKAQLTQAADGYDSTVDLTVQQLAMLQGDQSFRAEQLHLQHTGNVAGSEGTRSTGALTLKQVKAGGKSIDQQATITWQDLIVGDRLHATKLEVQATPVQLLGNNLGVDLQGGTVEQGQLQLAADLAQTMQLVAGLTGSAPPEIAGKVNFNANVTAEGKAQRLAGNGTIQQLTVGSGDSAVREEQLKLTLDAKIDPAGKTITLGQNRIDSEKIKLNVSGNLQDFTGKAVADLNGDYELSWPAVTALLHELAPSTREMLSVRGTSRSALSVRGPLNDPTAQPSFRGVQAGLDVGWDGIDLMGIPITSAKFSPKLQDGALSIPPASMGAVQGKVTLGGTLDLKPEAPLYTLPGNNRLLDGIAITPELAQDLLSRINPIFYGMLDTQGTVNLITNDLRVPLGGDLTGGRGNGKLELIDMKVRPGGLVLTLAELAGLAGANELLAIQLKGGEFALNAGRIEYDDFTILFPENVDLKFYGSVGLDDTLDLTLSIPIRAGVLKKLGVAGDAARYAEALEGTRIDVPLTGTRQQPKLQLDKVDTTKLMEGVLKGSVENQGKALLDGVLGGNKSQEQPADGSDTKAEESGKKKKKLGGLLQGLKDKKNKKKDKDKP